MNKTNVYYNINDLGKNIYRVKTFYTLTLEQDVLANDQDEAQTLLTDNGGINYDDLQSITHQKNGVATYFIDVDYSRSHSLEYLGKVLQDNETKDICLDDLVNEDIEQVDWKKLIK
jgi:hypothetical protein